jgi:hypothetical protein
MDMAGRQALGAVGTYERSATRAASLREPVKSGASRPQFARARFARFHFKGHSMRDLRAIRRPIEKSAQRAQSAL